MTLRKTTVVRAWVIVALGLACATPPPLPPEVDAPLAIQAIDTLRTTAASAYTLGNATAFASLYTIDAVRMANAQPTQSGRQVILDAAELLFRENRVRVDLTPDETHTQDAAGYERGRFRLRLLPKAGGEPIVEEGRYVMLFERTVNGWRIARELSNSTAPALLRPPR
jgi:ketosteroid isomerase-like protein